MRERSIISTQLSTLMIMKIMKDTSESSVMESIIEYSPPLNTKVDKK